MDCTTQVLERPVDNACLSSTFSTVILSYKNLFEQFTKRKYGSNLAQFWILGTLANEGELNMSTISRILELKYTTVADAARELNSASKIRKASRESDRRETVLAVTKAGVRYHNRIDLGLCSLTKEILSTLEPVEQKAILHAFYPYLNRIGKVITFNELIRGDSIFVVMLCEMTHILTDVFQKHGLSETHARILILLGNADSSIRPGLIAKTLNTDACNVSRVLRQLETEDYIWRNVGATTREKLVSLTPKGRDIAHILISDIEAEMATRLSIEDNVSFYSAMDKLAKNMADIRKYALTS